MLTAVSGRRVLVTNWGLVNRGGSELYVRDLAVGLLRRGCEPVVWSPLTGPVADDIRSEGVQVIDDLSTPIPEPDVLHCQHHDEALAALARFPGRPGLFVQHGAVPWQEEAPLHPRLLRYVAVDELCRARLLASGIDANRVTVIGNSVDLDRFAARDPLPARPRRALAFGNTAHEDGSLRYIRAACTRMGIELDVAGVGVGAPLINPEKHLADYDIVFAKARAALEALAVGCAVVVVDEAGVAGMVTADLLPEWLRWNLGRNLLVHPHDTDLLCDETDRYDPADVERCRDHVRAHCDLDAMIDALVAEQDHVLAEWARAEPPDPAAELVAASARLSLIGPLRNRDDALCAELATGRTRLEAVTEQRDAGCAELDTLRATHEAQRKAGEELLAQRDALLNRKAVRWVDAVASRRPGRAR